MLTQSPAGKPWLGKKLFQWLWDFFGQGLATLGYICLLVTFRTQKPQKLLCRGWDNKQAWILMLFMTHTQHHYNQDGCIFKTETSASVSFLFLGQTQNKACWPWHFIFCTDLSRWLWNSFRHYGVSQMYLNFSHLRGSKKTKEDGKSPIRLPLNSRPLSRTEQLPFNWRPLNVSQVVCKPSSFLWRCLHLGSGRN